MAGLAKLAKLGNTLWKGISYLPKKAHKLQQPFVAPAGGTLTKGQKVANGIFKTTEGLALAGIAAPVVGVCYNLIAANNTDDHQKYEKHTLNASKCMDALAGVAGGLFLGGPIGALALGTAAFLIPKDLVMGNAEMCKHGGKPLTINEVRQLRTQEAEEAEKVEDAEKQPEPTNNTPTAESDSIPAVKPDSVPAVKPDTVPAVKPDSVPAVKPDTIPAVKPDSVPTAKPDSVPTVKPDSVPAVKPDSVPAAKPDTIPAVKPDSVPAAKPDSVPAVKPDSVPAVKPDSVPAVKPDTVPAVKPDSVPAVKPDTVPAVKPDTVPAVKPDTVPAVKPDSVPAVKPDSVPAVKPDTIPAVKPDTVPAAKPDTIPAAKPDTVPAQPAQPAEDAQPAQPAQPAEQTQTPPRNNLFGGTINEISIKEYDVKSGDCLWNIAKRQLQDANPGVEISKGQILVQVNEFIRLNPQIKNPDLIYPNQKIKTAA